MSAPPPAEGVRLPWEKLPSRILAALEGWLGASVAWVSMQPGGFSPGVAARVRTADGRRVFVKAVGPELNLLAPEMCRQEARNVAALPPTVPVPRLLWTYDEGEDGWVMLVFEDIDGWNPAQPWRHDELGRVLDMMVALSTALTPSPFAAPSASDALSTRHCGWRRLRASLPVNLDGWSLRNLDELAELESGVAEAAKGDTLLHFDIRADNVILTADCVYLVDWPHVRRGAPWIDLVAMAPSVAMQGGPSPEELLRRHPAARDADPAAITAVLAAVAGFFTHQEHLPPPPGLPTLRAFQAAQGVVAREWLRERTELP